MTKARSPLATITSCCCGMLLLWPLVVHVATARGGTEVTGSVTPSDEGGGAHLALPSDELGPTERARIERNLRESLDTLRFQGRISPRAALAPVPFIWPLAPAPGFAHYGYHGISNFVDQNPSSGSLLDYQCNSRTYDGHRGTDFFTWPFPFNKMDNDEIHVVAAAPGTIILKSDGFFDRSCSLSGGPWNAVYIRHADDSVAWYGHLKKNSVTAKVVGDSVAQGEYLGIVGSSGNSTGPHLHLEIYDAASQLIDPYAGACNSLNPVSWWAAQRPYFDSAINHLSTGDAPVALGACPNQDDPNEEDFFAPGSTVYFTSYFRDQLGTQTGQHTIYRPDNSVFTSWSHSSFPATHYAASYWYWAFPIPIGEALGTWRYEIVFDGNTYDHLFAISNTPPTPTPTPEPANCPATPLPGCDTPEKSKLSFKVNGGAGDKIAWSFKKSTNLVSPVDFGDPTTADTIRFCIYDFSGGGVSALKFAAALPSGALWSAAGSKGYKYKDPTGNPTGITKVSLKGGSAFDPAPAKIKLKGAGTSLDDLIPPPLILPVRAQVWTSAGNCWQATYGAAHTNTGSLFKAKYP